MACWPGDQRNAGNLSGGGATANEKRTGERLRRFGMTGRPAEEKGTGNAEGAKRHPSKDNAASNFTVPRRLLAAILERIGRLAMPLAVCPSG